MIHNLDVDLVLLALEKWRKMITAEPDLIELKFDQPDRINQWIIVSLAPFALVNLDQVNLPFVLSRVK